MGEPLFREVFATLKFHDYATVHMTDPAHKLVVFAHRTGELGVSVSRERPDICVLVTDPQGAPDVVSVWHSHHLSSAGLAPGAAAKIAERWVAEQWPSRVLDVEAHYARPRTRPSQADRVACLQLGD